MTVLEMSTPAGLEGVRPCATIADSSIFLIAQSSYRSEEYA